MELLDTIEVHMPMQKQMRHPSPTSSGTQRFTSSPLRGSPPRTRSPSAAGVRSSSGGRSPSPSSPGGEARRQQHQTVAQKKASDARQRLKEQRALLASTGNAEQKAQEQLRKKKELEEKRKTAAMLRAQEEVDQYEREGGHPTLILTPNPNRRRIMRESTKKRH